MDETLKLILGVLGALVAIYYIARVVTYGVLKSMNDAKKRFNKKNGE